MTVSAAFEAAPIISAGYPVSVAQASNGSGVAMVDNVPVSSAESGSTVRFTPQPVDHTYRFTGWASAMVAGLYSYSLTAQQLAANPLDITMPAGAFVLTPKAFEKYIYNVSVSSSTTTEDGSTETAASTATVTNASGDPITEAEKTSSITFTAIPGTYTDDEGEEQTYLFTGWTSNFGYTLSAAQVITNPLTVTMPPNDMELVARFIEISDGIRVGNLIWATTNVAEPGVFAESPYLYDYISGVREHQYNYGVGIGGSSSSSVYNNMHGNANLNENIACPQGWHIPSKSNYESLEAISSIAEVTVTGPEGNVKGAELTIAGTGEKLFFSASGYEKGTSLGRFGVYQTSTLSSGGKYFERIDVYPTRFVYPSPVYDLLISVRCVRDI